MNTSPQPHSSTFEGRPLPRPGDEVVDQGLAFDVTTLMGRRQMLRTLGLGAVGIGLAACTSTIGSASSSTTSSAAGDGTAAAATGEIPEETAGPYPGDGSNGPDVLTESGIVRSDITTSFGEAHGTAQGVPMTLELTLTDIANGAVPFAGVAVYVWHCDREGRYSLYSDGVTDQNYLRGVQIADTRGVVAFTSIIPACYAGRWPHIHFEVYPNKAGITDATNAIATSQVALPKDMCDTVYAQPGYEASIRNLGELTLQSDNVFGDDAGVGQLATVTGDVTSGYTVTLAVGVDTATAPNGGQLRGDGAPSGAPTGGRGPAGEPPTGPRVTRTPATGAATETTSATTSG